jgi:hypothetical protein
MVLQLNFILSIKSEGSIFSVCFLYIGDNNLLRLHSDLKYLSHVVKSYCGLYFAHISTSI